MARLTEQAAEMLGWGLHSVPTNSFKFSETRALSTIPFIFKQNILFKSDESPGLHPQILLPYSGKTAGLAFAAQAGLLYWCCTESHGLQDEMCRAQGLLVLCVR